MSDFDPDAYLASKATNQSTVDPDAYLARARQEADEQPGSKLTSTLASFAQGVTGGFAPVLSGLTRVLHIGGNVDPKQLTGEAPPLDVMDEYRAGRDEAKAGIKKAQKGQPWYTTVLPEAIGGAVSLALAPELLPFKASAGAGLASRALTAGANGAVLGGVTGLANSDADLTKGQFSQAIDDANRGANIGAVIGPAAEVGSSLLSGAINKGVNGVRPIARWRLGAMNAAAPEGTTVSPGTGQHEAMRQLYEAFDNAYAPIHDASIPLEHPQFESSVMDPSVYASESERAKVLNWLNAKKAGLKDAPTTYDEIKAPGQSSNVATGFSGSTSPANSSSAVSAEPSARALPAETQNLLPAGEVNAQRALPGASNLPTTEVQSPLEGEVVEPKPRGEERLNIGETVQAREYLKMRSEIRQQIREMESQHNSNPAELRMLRNAANHVTDLLEQHLSPEYVEALQKADAQYGNLKVVENAVRKSGDSQIGFEPRHLTQAIKEATPNRRVYASGEGRLRNFAVEGQKLNQGLSPSARYHLASMVMPHRAASALRLLDTLPGQEAMTGTASWQQALQRALKGNPVQIPGAAKFSNALLQPAEEQ